MSNKRLPFRYPLEPLIRKQQSDWQTVKIEEVTAGTLVERQRTEVTRVQDQIGEAERALREAWHSGLSVDPVQQQLMASYLSQQRDLLEHQEDALQRARDVHDRILSNLEGIGRDIKSLEKHRASSKANHEVEQSRREQIAVDELWLLSQYQSGEDT